MNPKTNFETTVGKIRRILEYASKNGVLRDEILVQIIKQVTENPIM
jgi:hypothetical protein